MGFTLLLDDPYIPTYGCFWCAFLFNDQLFTSFDKYVKGGFISCILSFDKYVYGGLSSMLEGILLDGSVLGLLFLLAPFRLFRNLCKKD